MSKNILIVVLLIALGGFYHFHKMTLNEMNSLKADNEQLHQMLTQEKKQEVGLQEKLSEEATLLQQKELQAGNERNLKRQQLSDLTIQLNQELQNSKELKAKIADLQSVKNSSNQDSINNEIQKDQERLKTLHQRLAEYKSAEKEVSQSSALMLTQSKQEKKYEIATIDAGMVAQKQAIKGTNDQLQLWKKRKNYVNQSNRLDELSTQLQNQQQGLTQLQLKKQAAIQGDLEHTQSIKTGAGNERESIKDSEAQINAQIESINLELKNFQDKKDSTQKDINGIQQQIQEASRNLNLSQSKIQMLEGSVKRTQEDLDKVK